MQGFFDHGVMALTKKKHPVWVIRVRKASHSLTWQGVHMTELESQMSGPKWCHKSRSRWESH